MDPNRLTAIPLFSHLSEQEARRLAAFVTETSVAAGETLVRKGDYATELIAIEEGTADVLRDGHKLASLSAGDLIGEMGLLSRDAFAQVDALGDPADVARHDRADRADRQRAPRGRRRRSGSLTGKRAGRPRRVVRASAPTDQ
jgi:CRP-like cAMP-binding protein